MSGVALLTFGYVPPLGDVGLGGWLRVGGGGGYVYERLEGIYKTSLPYYGYADTVVVYRSGYPTFQGSLGVQVGPKLFNTIRLGMFSSIEYGYSLVGDVRRLLDFDIYPLSLFWSASAGGFSIGIYWGWMLCINDLASGRERVFSVYGKLKRKGVLSLAFEYMSCRRQWNFPIEYVYITDNGMNLYIAVVPQIYWYNTYYKLENITIERFYGRDVRVSVGVILSITDIGIGRKAKPEVIKDEGED